MSFKGEELAARVRQGDRQALARALTLVENRRPEAGEILSALYPHTGMATVLGLTGPPGVGKSTLADALAKQARSRGRRVGILAIDPSSPFTGGALLGDRARMESGSRDPQVFIRSMGTRGHVGGLAAATFEAIAILDAAGKDLILVETVGAGQDEVEVAAAAGLTLVILAPGMGDEIQVNKAGLLEIADILVVNKADRDGADGLVNDLSSTRETLASAPPVLKTVATTGEGVGELLEEAERREGTLGQEARRRFVEGWLEQVVRQILRDKMRGDHWEEAVDSVLTHGADPFAAARKVLNTLSESDREEGMKIHHLGIAVRNLDEGAARFGGLLKLDRGKRYDLLEWKVSVLFLPVGDSNLELLEPHDPDSNVGKFLARRGEGLHHVCFEVADIEASLRELEKKGAELIDRKPRPGAGGHLVAFVHPKSAHGVLVELKQQ